MEGCLYSEGIGLPSMPNLSFQLLKLGSAETTNAIISSFGLDPAFSALAAAETSGILQRDAEDAEKLVAGINQAVAKGVLPAEPAVEATTQIDVLGKSVDEVCDRVHQVLGRAPTEQGCILVLSGLSGTGKGTTVAKLQASLPRATTWSNGNIFRALTLLALDHCDAHAHTFSEDALTPELLSELVGRLEFAKVGGVFDIKIHVDGEAAPLLVSEVQNTRLKEPRVGKAIPTLAKMTQGEVVAFASRCAEAMRSDGMNVLIEGRKQTLDYVRTPHRQEPSLLPQRACISAALARPCIHRCARRTASSSRSPTPLSSGSGAPRSA